MQVKRQPKAEYRVILTNADIRRLFRDALKSATGDVLVLDQAIYVFVSERDLIPDADEEWLEPLLAASPLRGSPPPLTEEDATFVLGPHCRDDDEIVALIMAGGDLAAVDVTIAPPALQAASEDPGDADPPAQHTGPAGPRRRRLDPG